jgi:hypothetical protein
MLKIEMRARGIAQVKKKTEEMKSTSAILLCMKKIISLMTNWKLSNTTANKKQVQIFI